MIYSTPPNIVRFAKIFTTGSAETEKNKKQKKKKFEKFKFLQERDVPKIFSRKNYSYRDVQIC